MGTFHYFAILGMTSLGVASEVAAGFAILTHVLFWLPLTLTGGTFLFTFWGVAALQKVRGLNRKEHYGRVNI